MVATLPPIPDGTCMSDIATDTADPMLPIAAELVTRCKRPLGAQGWCAWPGDERSTATERGSEEALTLRTSQQQPSKGREDGWKHSSEGAQGCRAEHLLRLRPQTRTRTREGVHVSFYKHLNTMNLEGKQDHSSAYVKNENGVLLRDVELIRERWARWFHTLLSVKSPRLDPKINAIPQYLSDAQLVCSTSASQRTLLAIISSQHVVQSLSCQSIQRPGKLPSAIPLEYPPNRSRRLL